MPKYKKKRDSNDSEVIKGLPDAFRDLPLKCMDTSSYPGMLDRLIFLGDMGLFVEIKTEKLAGKTAEKVLTKREKKFAGPFFIVHSQQELLNVLADQYDFALAYSAIRNDLRTHNVTKEKRNG